MQGEYAVLQELLESERKHPIAVIALMPGSLAESKHYLESNGIAGVDVRTQPPEEIPAMATPTLVSVDSSGRIEKLWVGALDPARDDEVFSQLGVFRKAWSDSPRISGEEAQRLLRTNAAVRMVDTRSAAEFARKHLAGALSMPVAEIDYRVSSEVPMGANLILICDDCQSSLLSLHRNGVRRVNILATKLDRMGLDGFEIVATTPAQH